MEKEVTHLQIFFRQAKQTAIKILYTTISVFMLHGWGYAQLNSHNPTPAIDFNKFYWPSANTYESWREDSLSGEDWFYSVNTVVDPAGKPIGYIGAGYSQLPDGSFQDGCGNTRACADGVDFNRFEMTDTQTQVYTQIGNGDHWCNTLPIPKLAFLDLNGNINWYKYLGDIYSAIGEFGVGVFYKTAQLPSGNIIAVGKIRAQGGTSPHAILYNPLSSDNGESAQTIGCSSTKDLSQGYIAEMDLKGNLIWQFQYGNEDNPDTFLTSFYDLVPLTDGTGDVIVVGKTQQTSGVTMCDGEGHAPYDHALIMRINSSGQIVNKRVLSSIANTYISTTTGGVTTTTSATYTQVGSILRSATDVPPAGSRTDEEIAVSGYLQDQCPDHLLNWGNDKAVAVVLRIDPVTLEQIGTAYTVGGTTSGTVSVCTYGIPHGAVYQPDATAFGIKYNAIGDNIVASVLKQDGITQNCGSCAENFHGDASLQVHFIPAGSTTSLGDGRFIYDCGTVGAFDLGAAIAVQADGSFAVISSQLPASNNTPYFTDNCAHPFAPVVYTPSCSTPNLQSYDKSNQGWGNQGLIAKFDYSGRLLWNMDIASASTPANFGDYDFNNIPPNTYGNVGNPKSQGDIKKQTCFYKIAPTADGGFIMCGNNSNNLDDDVLIKIQPDCQANLLSVLAPQVGHTNNNITNDTHYYNAGNQMSNVVWSTSRVVDAQVTVDKGVTLYIEGPNTTIQFTDTRQVGHASNITVLPGGRLIVANGATITGYNACSNNQWEGIYALGAYTLTDHVQTPAKSGVVRVESGSTIANARNGIMSDGVDHYDAYWNPVFSVANRGALTGGIIQCDNANFVNNINAVYMSPFYSYSFSNGTHFIANKSYLNNCSFTVNDDMPAYIKFKTFVTLNQVLGIQISACIFTNSQTNIYQDAGLGIGINAVDASFSVTNPCPAINGNCIITPPAVYMDGLDYGIRAQNVVSGNTFTCNNQSFTRCVFGIKCEGVNNAVITQNNFYMGNSPAVNEPEAPNGLNSNVGVAMENSTGFTVEENSFTKSTTPTGNGYYTIGTWMNNTQVADNDDNQLYKNTFTGLEQAHVANRVNRGSGLNALNHGLSYFCNQHTDIIDYDIAVDIHGSVRLNQGSATLSAGNIFDAANGDGGYYGNFGNFPHNDINYYYFGPRTSNNRYPGQVTSDVSRTLAITDNTCPSHISGGVLPIYKHLSASVHAGLINNYNISKTLIESANNQIATLTDNGNTAGLLSDIAAAKTPTEVSALCTELISASPYLSATCLSAFANLTNYTSVPQSQAYQVLAGNPEQLRNDTVWQSILSMATPFDSVYMAGLDSSRLTTSAMGLIQATTINNTDSADFAVRALLNDDQLHLYDTTGTGYMVIDTTAGFIVTPPYNYDSSLTVTLPDSVGMIDTTYRNTLLLKNSPSAAYDVAFNYLAEGDSTNALATFTGIASSYVLDSAYTGAYNDLDTLLGIIQGNQLDSISNAGVASLQAMAAKTSIASSRVQNLLRNYYGKRYESYPDLTYGTGGSYYMLRAPAAVKPIQPVAQNNVKVFPNPAGNYITFQFKAPDNNDLNLYIYNTTGILVYQTRLNSVTGQQVVMVNNWTNGIYGYSIRGAANNIGAGTFIVSH